MNYSIQKKAFRTVAAFISLSISFVCLLIIAISLFSGLYTKGVDYAWKKYLNDKCYSDAYNAYSTYCVDYMWSKNNGQHFNSNYYDNIYDESRTNFRFACVSNDKMSLPGYSNEFERAQYVADFSFENEWEDSQTESTYYFSKLDDVEKSETIIKARLEGKEVIINLSQNGRGYNVNINTKKKSIDKIDMQIYIPIELTAVDEYYIIYSLISLMYEFKNYFVIAGLAFFAIGAYFLIRLVFTAGHHEGTDKIVLLKPDKIPADLFVVITLALEIGLFEVLIYCLKRLYYFRLDSLLNGSIYIIFALVCISFMVLIGIYAIISMATRFKVNGFLDKCVIVRIGKYVSSVIKKIILAWRNIKAFLRISLMFLILDALLGLISFLGIDTLNIELIIVLSIVLLLLVCVEIVVVYNIYLLEKSLNIIADGQLDYKIDEKKFLKPFKKTVNAVNHISDGMSIALKDQIKSEHFKTELITNVSHDIKTPLTSIMNYVGLLQQSKVSGEEAQEYLEVLERQSGKLKKLIEDLIEASRASTGNLSLDFVNIEITTIVSQALAEYYDKFESKGLSVKLDSDGEYEVRADGQHLWRVFDNLLGNIYKYALENTRVYVEIKKSDESCFITFKNISKYEIQVTPEELTERFVRGDKSRNTEGSGLGLSIARNLTEAMNGRMYIDMDGDLYKAVVELPLAVNEFTETND